MERNTIAQLTLTITIICAIVAGGWAVIGRIADVDAQLASLQERMTMAEQTDREVIEFFTKILDECVRCRDAGN